MSNQEKVHPMPVGVQITQPESSNPQASTSRPINGKPTSSLALNAQTVDESAPALSSEAQYRHKPVKVICHACQAVVVTAVRPKMGMALCGSIFALIFFGCYLGCCLIPLCVRDMYDTVHACPNCKTQVGIFKVLKI